MKILVTGGAGFIGSHVAQIFLKAGLEVVIVDNLSTGKKENIPLQAKFYEADIGDFAALEKIFQKESPEVINHHAAKIDVRKSVIHPQKDAQTNIIGGLHLLELCRKYNVSRFIYAGTGGALYGEAADKPSAETSPICAMSPYGISKYCLEHYIRLYGRLYGLSSIILRYANVYGPRQNPLGEAGVVAIFIHAMHNKKNPIIYGDGKQMRDYVYVEDVALANLKALNSSAGNTFNIGSGQITSVNELFALLQSLFEFPGNPQHHPQRHGEIFKSWLDITLAKKALDWQPQTPLKEGLKKTALWQRGLDKSSTPC